MGVTLVADDRLDTRLPASVAPVESPVGGTRRLPRAAYVLPMAVVVLMRLRFLSSPLTVDEGGYLAVARAWARGSRLYGDVWVDRPQGLLLLYRSLHTLGLGTPMGVRLLALGACAVGVLACGHIAARLSGERARLPASLFVAVFTSLPQIEGHTANAELLSASVGAIALALCLEAPRHLLHVDRWMLAAGCAGGAGLSIKQSAFDALGAALVAVLVVGAVDTNVRARVRSSAILAGGASLPVGLCALHGARTGWDRWWFAVAGYRLRQRSMLVDARWDRIGVVWSIVRQACVVLVVVLIIGAIAAVVASSASRRAVVVLTAWCLFAALAFMLGGQFFRHYWTILSFPTATAAGVVVGSVAPRTVRVALTVLVLFGPGMATIDAVLLPRQAIGPTLHADARLVKSERVAEWFTAWATPGDELYVLCVSAAVYGNGDIDPPYPYLWWDGVRQIPGAKEELIELLSSSERPRFLAAFQSPQFCDASGRVAHVVRAHYVQRAIVDGVPILEALP